MDDWLKILIISSCLLVVIICILCIVYSITKKNSIKKMYFEIESTLESLIIEENKNDYNLQKLYLKDYDYIFETPLYIYYIKIVPNTSNQEICVNNSVKWQLRKSFNDETMRFVENIEGLMRMDIPSSKPLKKLYIIYPNARTLLKYINECEMVFIHPTTDVYGANIIPFVQLKDNPNLIKTNEEI